MAEANNYPEAGQIALSQRVWCPRGVRAGATRWESATPRILAILNLTPDSFSDGGLHLGRGEPGWAAWAEGALAEGAGGRGADGFDIGGESTRPGAQPVAPAEQIARVLPALVAIRAAVGMGPIITIDTTSAEVARAALDAGADAVNDVSAGLDDAAMLPLIAERGCGVILMHRLRLPRADVYSHQYADPAGPKPVGGDVVAAVRSVLGERLASALAAGVPAESVLLDPGLGFGKTAEQNLELLERTGELLALGRPILSGLSRKSFTARFASASGGDVTALPPAMRDEASAMLSRRHWAAGASIFRVHNVALTRAALRDA